VYGSKLLKAAAITPSRKLAKPDRLGHRKDAMKKRVFVSSVQKEFTAERRALKDYIQEDALLGRFFEVFLFEDMPASNRRADEVYLGEVDRCDVYMGLLGNDYGY